MLLLSQIQSLKIYTVCCIFCGFWQTYWDTCHYNIINNSLAVRNRLCCAWSASVLLDTDLFTVRIICLFQNVLQPRPCSVWSPRTDLLRVVIRTWSFHMCFESLLLSSTDWHSIFLDYHNLFVLSLKNNNSITITFKFWQYEENCCRHIDAGFPWVYLFYVYECSPAGMFVHYMCSWYLWRWKGVGCCDSWVI